MTNKTLGRIENLLTLVHGQIGGALDLEHKQVVYAENKDGDQLLVKVHAQRLQIVAWARCLVAEKRKRCAATMKRDVVWGASAGPGQIFTFSVSENDSLTAELAAVAGELSHCGILSMEDRVWNGESSGGNRKTDSGSNASENSHGDLPIALPWVQIPELCELEGLTTKYDERLKRIEGLTWLPWVGENYGKDGHKVLILSESSYAGADMATDRETACELVDHDNAFVRKVISNFCVKGNGNRILKQANKRLKRMHGIRGEVEKKRQGRLSLSSLSGLRQGNGDAFWQEVAFMDVCQKSVYGANSNPSKQDYIAGWLCVRDVVAVLNPQWVIVATLAAADACPVDDSIRLNFAKDKAIQIGDCYPRVASWRIRERTSVQVFAIHHPSNGFSSRAWGEYLRAHGVKI